jgi:asparagine synthase (glutamine-hydrolysing)
MPGIFGVIDLPAGSERLDSARVDLVRRMAAAMSFAPGQVVDIVSCPTLATCAGRVGWAYSRPAEGRGSSAAGGALLTAGEPVLSGPSVAMPDHGWTLVGSGGAALAGQLERHGIEGLQEVDGSFSGFLIDPRRGQCILFNDRYGVERLFVYTDRDRVLFSSEAKAILAVVSSARAFDPAGLAEWLACGCTIGTRSLYQNTEVLAAGTAIRIDAGKSPVRTRYFDRSRLEQLPPLPANQFAERFRETLTAAVNTAVARSPRAALSLTGGLESRLVMACLDAGPHTVPCYTFGSMYRPTMDVVVAKAVAARCDQPHHELKLDREFLARIDADFRDAVYASDGYLGLTGSSELYLNKLASGVAPARVTGNWGGELLRGVRAFKFRMPKGQFILPVLREAMTDVEHAFARPSEWNSLSYTLFHQVPHQGFARYSVERSQVHMRSPFLSNDVVKVLYQSTLATRSSMDVVRHVLSRRPGLIDVPTDTGRLGRSSRPVAKMRQAWRRVMVKAEYLTSHGAPDWLAAVSAPLPFLETAFLGRDKFQHFRHWMRHELSGVVRNGLSGSDPGELGAWFDMRRVSRMAEDQIAGRANYTDELDKVMTVAMCHRTILSGRASARPSGAPPARELMLDAAAARVGG